MGIELAIKYRKKLSFKVKVGDKELNLAVQRPSLDQQKTAQAVFNKEFAHAINSGAFVRARISKIAEEQIWGSVKEKFDKLQAEVRDNEALLADLGKHNLTIEKAKEIAIGMRKARTEVSVIQGERNSVDGQSAEAQAENMKINYYISACTVYDDTSKPYYESLQDYMGKVEDPVALESARRLTLLLYNVEPDFESKKAENAFLLKNGFAKVTSTNEVCLVNEQGKFIDDEGHLIREADRRFVNEKGELVDRTGNLVDEDGNIKVVESAASTPQPKKK